MKKIVCPHCQKVNYDAFASYPYCAQCGHQLPDTNTPNQTSLWKKPLGTLLWVGLLGLVAVALAAAFMMMRSPTPNTAQLLVYGSTIRSLPVNSQTIMHLSLDTVDSDKMFSNSELSQVELRIPTKLLQNWTLVSITPAPSGSYTRGDGTYYKLGKLPVNSSLFLTWRPHKEGAFRINISIFALRYNPVRYQTIITVTPQNGDKKEKPDTDT